MAIYGPFYTNRAINKRKLWRDNYYDRITDTLSIIATIPKSRRAERIRQNDRNRAKRNRERKAIERASDTIAELNRLKEQIR